MTNVLWIVNKYISGKDEEVFYPEFLKVIQESATKMSYCITFAFFSDSRTSDLLLPKLQTMPIPVTTTRFIRKKRCQ